MKPPAIAMTPPTMTGSNTSNIVIGSPHLHEVAVRAAGSSRQAGLSSISHWSWHAHFQLLVVAPEQENHHDMPSEHVRAEILIRESTVVHCGDQGGEIDNAKRQNQDEACCKEA